MTTAVEAITVHPEGGQSTTTVEAIAVETITVETIAVEVITVEVIAVEAITVETIAVQLYVAFSRVTDPSALAVCLNNPEGFTRNIVFQEVW